MTRAETTERVAPTPQRADTNDFDPDDYAHYCDKGDIARLKRGGGPITALCGARLYRFRDPSRYPVCPKCTVLREGVGGGAIGAMN
jgi:hypothetical protein